MKCERFSRTPKYRFGLSFLLLDANVVIYLFELGIWDRLVTECDVYLARTAAEDEVRYWYDEKQERTRLI